MKQKRDIAILDWNGRLVISLSPVLTNQGMVKISQYEAHNNPQKQARIAKWLIEQKIEGSLRVLEWLSKAYSSVSHDSVIEKCASRIRKTQDLKSILHIEAVVSKLYWKALALTFDKKWEFFNRNYGNGNYSKDADDPINALFNYGYSILESECWKVANTVGLEPYIGFVHKTHTNRAPLIYDLQEPFRWIVEMAILTVLYEKKVNKADFITTEEGNVRLKPSGVKVVLDEIAKQFSVKIDYKGVKREWQTMIMIRTRELVKSFD